jgi:protein-S-isoprenylcysteine O-methyltransferase Ste14
MDSLARWTIALTWTLCVVRFVVNWFQVQAHRKRHGEVWEGRREDKPSRLGLYLQGGIALAFVPGAGSRPDWLLALAAVLAFASTIFVFAALRHLGAQWRINTVVTADHRLVTAGPYSVVRHPVYTALLGMAIATALTIPPWYCGLAAVLIYSVGTEIRVRAEDSLLASHFGQRHRAWKARTSAWIPGLR